MDVHASLSHKSGFIYSFWICFESHNGVFYLTALKDCQGIVFTHGVQMGVRVGVWVGGWQVKVCPGYISETIRCRKLILGRDIG